MKFRIIARGFSRKCDDYINVTITDASNNEVVVSNAKERIQESALRVFNQMVAEAMVGRGTTFKLQSVEVNGLNLIDFDAAAPKSNDSSDDDEDEDDLDDDATAV